jgi:DNA-binding beta-propeller fold protein YncE
VERLRVRGGSAGGRELDIGDGNELVVGRGLNGLDDTEISQRHARISRLADGRMVIEDLGSEGGTFVNGERIDAPRSITAGDRIRIGRTILEVFDPESDAQTVAAPIASARLAKQTRSGSPAILPPFSPPRPPSPRPWERTSYLGLVAIIVAVVLVAGLSVVIFKDATRVAQPFECVDHPDTGQPVAVTAYVEANLASRNGNAILVLRYAEGDLYPLPIDCFRTGGSGSHDLADVGVLDADQQVIVDASRNRLLAVNQGSDSIAVFDIEPNGDLRSVPGSPFPSGGTAPVSLGLSGNHLLVVNKAHDGVRDLTSFTPNITSFTIQDDGSLTPVPGSMFALPVASNPTQALISPDGRAMFGTNPRGPLRAFRVNDDGTFVEGPDSPQRIDLAAFPSGFPSAYRFALGLAVHPTLPLLYASLSRGSALAVYRYDSEAALTFVGATPNRGSWLPCWTIVSPDGRHVYTANAGSETISVFDIGADPESPRQIQSVAFRQPGNPWNLGLDPSGRFLLVLNPRNLPGVPAGAGNTLHLLQVFQDGTVKEVASALVKLPIPVGTNPQGLAVT